MKILSKSINNKIKILIINSYQNITMVRKIMMLLLKMMMMIIVKTKMKVIVIKNRIININKNINK